MSANNSLADDVIAALSEVRRIGENMDNEHPLRHSVRDMKRTAENIIADAMRSATDLAYQAWAPMRIRTLHEAPLAILGKMAVSVFSDLYVTTLRCKGRRTP